MNATNAEQEVERIFKMVDKNNSGSIDYTGFERSLILYLKGF
jgi:Ca2+-binding EF-hand superfamily protein